MAIFGTRVALVDVNSAADANALSTRALDKQGTNQLSALSEESSPVSGDWFLMEDAVSGELVKVDTDNMPGGGTTGVSIQATLKGNAYTGTAIATVRVPWAMTITDMRIGARTPPTGSSLSIDANYSATNPDSASPLVNSILNSPPLSITAGNHTALGNVFAISSFAAGSWLVIDIDAVGSTLPGTDITIEFIGTIT